jgi:pyridoxal phosphate enzyme (YggS family)
MTENQIQVIEANYNAVLKKIEFAARRAGRLPEDIQLVVVSKRKSVEVIEEAYDAGARIFGENYPEQTLPKIEALKTKNIEWHMIGHLQSRKAEIVADHFSLLHSLDSTKLANKLNTILLNRGKQLRVLLEVNVSGEMSKEGWAAWDENVWPDLIIAFGKLLELPGLKVEGLMCMPPYSLDPENSRPVFVKLRRFQAYLMKGLGEAYWKDLSIGTSHDYSVAIEEGARYIRVGQAILGERET